MPLHTRIGLLAAGFVLTAIALLSVLAFQFQRTTSITWAQRLNYELASYIVDHLARPLIQDDGTTDTTLMKDLAMDTMMVNPSVELYLLDETGQVMAHALEGGAIKKSKIDLAPIYELLRAKKRGLINPVWGDDPRALGAKGGFSVAPIQSLNGKHNGYLYIILYGEQSRRAAEQLERDSRNSIWLSFIILACLVGLMAAYLAFHFLTRPLRLLISQMVQNANAADSISTLRGDEISVLSAEFERLNQRIASQFTQLTDNDVQRRELIANLSHDMRTPLAGIQGYIELASQGTVSHQTAQALDVALKHCKVMNKRLDDLLMVARLDSNGTDLIAERLSLKELIYDLVAGLQASANKANVELKVDEINGHHSNFEFVGDIGLLERLFTNLVENALSFTDAGGQILIELSDCDAKHYKVCVIDTGCGMNTETLAHAFERNWSSRSSTGFGLAIVQKICRLHAIELSVQSHTEGPNRGTQFELLFALPSVSTFVNIS